MVHVGARFTAGPDQAASTAAEAWRTCAARHSRVPGQQQLLLHSCVERGRLADPVPAKSDVHEKRIRHVRATLRPNRAAMHTPFAAAADRVAAAGV